MATHLLLVLIVTINATVGVKLKICSLNAAVLFESLTMDNPVNE
jgi:hypothetical protein